MFAGRAVAWLSIGSFAVLGHDHSGYRDSEAARAYLHPMVLRSVFFRTLTIRHWWRRGLKG